MKGFIAVLPWQMMGKDLTFLPGNQTIKTHGRSHNVAACSDQLHFLES